MQGKLTGYPGPGGFEDTIVDVESIPQALKDRDHWLLWDNSSSTPRRPHWNGDFMISWSDPSDWHSFEEAVDLARNNESWGIGFVFFDEEPHDDPFYVIDIDGPIGDDGELRDWVPRLSELEGEYMEWSPGAGIHAILEGEPPDWWTDSEVAPEVHQGVDVFEKKFCTITGAGLEIGGEMIRAAGVDPWLTRAYTNIRGEAPDKGDSGSVDADIDLEEEDIEEALGHLDPSMPYNEWIRIGFAVYNWSSGGTGRSVFENWSRQSPKWDDEAEKTVDWIWSEATQDGGITVGTLIYEAKQRGYDIPEDKFEGDSGMTRTERLDKILSDYDPQDDSPTSTDAKSIRTLAARVDDDTYRDRRGGIADLLDWPPSQLDRHRRLQRHVDAECQIQVDDGKTYYIRFGDNGAWREEVLNFELDVRSILRVDGRELVDTKIWKNGGEMDTIQFRPYDLKKKQRFEDNVLGSRFGMNFEPPQRKSMDVLNSLNRWISTRDVPVRRGTHHIGLHGSEVVFPDGTLTPSGWTDDAETIYVDRDIATERKVDIDGGVEMDGDAIADAEEILTSIDDIRKTDRFLPAITWFYAAPFRPPVFDDWGAGAFNHLSVTGETGSGKTTSLRYLWKCFGVDGDPFDVTDTRFALMASMSSSRGIPMWYDEYKPGDIQSYKIDRFHDLYRKSATGGMASRGTQDQNTREYHFHAPVVVSGEEQIRPPAERRRSIMVTFSEETTRRGAETREAFKELVGEGRIEDGEITVPDDAPEPINHAIVYYRWLASVDEDRMHEKWQDAKELAWSMYEDWGDIEIDLDDMEMQGLQTVVFGWLVMRTFAEDHGFDTGDLPDRDDVNLALRHVVEEIGPGGKRKSHVDQFVEAVGRAASSGALEKGEDYKVVNEGDVSAEELRFHLGNTYDKLSKYVRDHDLDSIDLLSNPNDYRDRMAEMVDDDGYVVKVGQYTPGFARCVGINPTRAMQDLDFDRAWLGVEPADDFEVSQAQYVEEIKEIFRENEGGPIRPNLVRAVGKERGLDPEKIDHHLDNMKQRGAVYESGTGQLSLKD